MNKKITTHVDAEFDIEQIGARLDCKITRSDGDGNPVEGKYAGGVYMTCGETLVISVKVGGKMRKKSPPFASFEVVDCSIVTRPKIKRTSPHEKTEFAHPTPFVSGASATVIIPGEQFVPADVEHKIPEYYQLKRVFDSGIVVGTNEGRWGMSIMLTLRINYTDNAVSEMRVVETDPETEVGSGTQPP
jgi:hypothetical protein